MPLSGKYTTKATNAVWSSDAAYVCNSLWTGCCLPCSESFMWTSWKSLTRLPHLLSNFSHISKISWLFLKVKCVIFAMIRFLLFYRITSWRHRWLRDVFYAASLSATIVSLNNCLLFILDKIFKTEANTDSPIFSISVISSQWLKLCLSIVFGLMDFCQYCQGRNYWYPT